MPVEYSEIIIRNPVPPGVERRLVCREQELSGRAFRHIIHVLRSTLVQN